MKENKDLRVILGCNFILIAILGFNVFQNLKTRKELHLLESKLSKKIANNVLNKINENSLNEYQRSVLVGLEEKNKLKVNSFFDELSDKTEKLLEEKYLDLEVRKRIISSWKQDFDAFKNQMLSENITKFDSKLKTKYQKLKESIPHEIEPLYPQEFKDLKVLLLVKEVISDQSSELDKKENKIQTLIQLKEVFPGYQTSLKEQFEGYIVSEVGKYEKQIQKLSEKEIAVLINKKILTLDEIEKIQELFGSASESYKEKHVNRVLDKVYRSHIGIVKEQLEKLGKVPSGEKLISEYDALVKYLGSLKPPEGLKKKPHEVLIKEINEMISYEIQLLQEDKMDSKRKKMIAYQNWAIGHLKKMSSFLRDHKDKDPEDFAEDLIKNGKDAIAEKYKVTSSVFRNFSEKVDDGVLSIGKGYVFYENGEKISEDRVCELFYQLVLIDKAKEHLHIIDRRLLDEEVVNYFNEVAQEVRTKITDKDAKIKLVESSFRTPKVKELKNLREVANY